MKVRHKVHHSNQHTVIEESPSYYICDLAPQPPAAHAMLSKVEYEPIHDDRWQDVTGECEVTKQGNGIHDPSKGGSGLIHLYDNYRIRKVRLDELLDHPDQQYTKWAFIIERKTGK